MRDLDKSKNQLIADLQQLRQKEGIMDNKASLFGFNKFISIAKDNVSLIDKNYLYFDVNQTYLNAHKIKREDVVGKFVKDIFGEEIFTNFIKENVDKCLLGKVIKYQKWFDFPKNVRKYMDVAYYPYYDENNSILGVLVSSHDITELKIKEELLANNELKQKILIQNIPGMVYTNIPHGVKEVVKGAEEICGYPDKDLRSGKIKWINIVHPNDREKLLFELESLLKKANTIICTYRIITKKEEIRWVEDHMTSSFYEKENYFRIDGIVLDITVRKKADLKLKELNATKDKFFSIIAHDLKSPFNTMLGFSKLLIDNFDTYSVKEQKKLLNYLSQDIQNTYKLLENLLMWSQTQRGKIEFNPETLNLYLLAHETIEVLSQTAVNKLISIKNEVPENISVKADSAMLATILRNLISNAIKFTPKNGTVEIGCRVSPIKTNDRSSQQANSIEVYVKDNGIGIPKEKQIQLFKISENISTVGTEGETGTGLGLILCKEFVEKNGGKIRVVSEIGKGSEFIFTLKTD